MVLDSNIVLESTEEAKALLFDLMEDCYIIDPDLPQEEPENQMTFTPQEEELDTFHILPTNIEVDSGEKRLRAVMYGPDSNGQDTIMHMIGDWVDYDPDADASLPVADALSSIAECIRRRFNLSQLPEDQQ